MILIATVLTARGRRSSILCADATTWKDPKALAKVLARLWHHISLQLHESLCSRSMIRKTGVVYKATCSSVFFSVSYIILLIKKDGALSIMSARASLD